jgi:hypothetical protein
MKWLIVFCLFSLLTGGCEKRPAQAGAVGEKESQQAVMLPTEADLQRLSEQRAVVEKFLGDESSRQEYQTAPGKLGVIRGILQARTFKANQTYELQCLGVVLGDVFVQDLKMEWVMVEDEHGRDPAVRLPGSSIILYPVTMISKRVERGVPVDAFDIYNAAANQVEELKRKSY